jgi:hypothetical protein
MDTLLKSMLPQEIYLHFELTSLTEKSHGFEMVLEESAALAPAELVNKPCIVLDGFRNPVELLHFHIKGKPLYLKLYRRRWKESGGSKHYSNSYNLHPAGAKTAHEFASFLKGEVGCTTDEYVRFLLGTEPFYKFENFGKAMAVDEKQIGDEMHTIVSNRETGKTALMVRSMCYEDLQKPLTGESIECRGVETLTRDLSPLYAKVGNNLFFNSSAVADKFHIIRSLPDACQDVRVRLRQGLLRDRRLKHEAHKKQEKQRKKECQACGKEYVNQSFKYEEEELSNRETILEALARSRYLLFKYSDDWPLSQCTGAYALFEKFPEIKKVYDRCREFRGWMKKENVGRSIRLLMNVLQTWM